MSWRRFLYRDRRDADHGDEMRCHIEIEIEENIGRGMSPEEARRAAHRRFGNPASIREEVYTMNSIGPLETLWRDLRYSARMLARNPGFTAAAVVCLGLGMGATTAIFSVVHAVLLRPLPYAHADRLVRVYTQNKHMREASAARFSFSGPELLTFQKEATVFDILEAWQTGGANIVGGQEPIRPAAAFVTGGLLPALGVAPARGRLISRDDGLPGAPCVLDVSYGFWQKTLGGDPEVLKREILFSGRKCSIIGVMPPGFQFPPGETDPPQLWTALSIDPRNPYNHVHSVLGILKPQWSVPQARKEIDALITRIEAQTGGAVHLGFGRLQHSVAIYPFQDEVTGGARTALLVLLAAVGFVLLIACVNVANLLLARAEARRREIVIRKAIGAGLGMLVRQFVAEGLMLSMAGAAAGLAIAFAGVRMLGASNAGDIPRSAEIGIDWGVLLFTLALSIATGVAFGLAPVAQLATRNLHDMLKSAASRNTSTAASARFRHGLVVGELALALVLLIGTGLMVQAFWNLQRVDIGMNPGNLLTMRFTMPGGVYPKADRVVQFWGDAQRRVESLPGVTSASLMGGLPPLRGVVSNTTPVEGWVSSEGRNSLEVEYYQMAGPRFFETMGIRLLEGRFFDDRDGADAPKAVIVNQSLARTLWPQESALGHRMQPYGPPNWYTVVGVVADVKNAGVDQVAGTELFLPYRQAFPGALRTAFLAVRTRGRAGDITEAVRREVHALDPAMPVSMVREMDEVVASVRSRPRLLTLLLTMFAAVALVLASVGIYGVISYSVAQRTNEFGIRIAIGAGSGDVLRLVMRQGMVLGLVGVALGAAGSFWLTRFLKGVLFGISAVDPWTFVVMALVLGAVTLAACYVPARRATKVDPTVALRYE